MPSRLRQVSRDLQAWLTDRVYTKQQRIGHASYLLRLPQPSVVSTPLELNPKAKRPLLHRPHQPLAQDPFVSLASDQALPSPLFAAITSSRCSSMRQTTMSRGAERAARHCVRRGASLIDLRRQERFRAALTPATPRMRLMKVTEERRLCLLPSQRRPSCQTQRDKLPTREPTCHRKQYLPV
jgi:hypothetical protein